MAMATREFMICDRCFKEEQHYEVDDEGRMSTNDWQAIINPANNRRLHLCPKCSDEFGFFLNGEKIKAIDPELKDHNKNGGK